jgi:hypothetical protein
MSIGTRAAVASVVVAMFGLGGRAATTDVDFGGLVLSTSDSSTAQTFHIVDQLSEWDAATHKAYGRWAAKNLPLDQDDKRLLQQHAALRRARGWNHGFEQAFYVDDPVPTAAQKAIEGKLLSADEAAAETAILMHFVPKLSPMRDGAAPRVAAFMSRLSLESKGFAPLVQKLVRFADARTPVRVPLLLVPAPEESGGAFGSGRLVIEVGEQADPMPLLFHESLRALLRTHDAEIAAASQSCGLAADVFAEAIAYAIAPGLMDKGDDGDRLAEGLVRDVTRARPAADPAVQSSMIAIVIRPMLRAALDRGDTIVEFLPKAAARWRDAISR